MLTQLIIEMPDKGVSAINFTLTGFDVVGVVPVVREGKVCDYNRITEKESKFIIYGGKDVLDNTDKLIVSGYQTAREVKIEDCTGASPEAERVDIFNRYYRITDR